jgi:hypothetical protein
VILGENGNMLESGNYFSSISMRWTVDCFPEFDFKFEFEKIIIHLSFDLLTLKFVGIIFVPLIVFQKSYGGNSGKG